MANKIYIGETNVSNVKLGTADVTMYLGENKVYPIILLKWFATYGSNITASAECSNNTTISSYEIVSTKGTNKDILSVTVGDCVTSIGSQAFYNYTTLTSCTIGSGVTRIGNDAFNGCKRLTNIDIPDSVTSIGNSAFANCSGMTDVTIGSGVTSIGDWAFQTHTNMNSITITAPTPPTLGTAPFLNTGNCPIYVPSASVNAYKTETNWSSYASRIFPIP